MEFTIEQVALLLNGKVEGDGSEKVDRLDKIQEGKPGGISFLANEKYEAYIYTTEASAVIVSEDFKAKKAISTNLIRVKDAYIGFTQILEAYAQSTKYNKSGIEEPAFMHHSSTIGFDFYRGAFSYIGKNCAIGNNVKIYPNVSIGDNVKIGDNCIIQSGVKIGPDCIIGSNCEFHSGVVIGSDGFGFAPQKDGTYKTIPQIGNVIIEDNVNIGANTTIDRATMGSTILRKGVKLDNLVQIAHNVIIGENTVIAAQVGVSGSTEIGKNCIIAGKSGIVGHIKIADNTTIGGNTGVSKSITEPGQTLFGYVGFEMKSFLKSYAIFRNLPLLHDRLRELEKKQ
jgi:UDP-3-O-[3-hydroxymyristoyl] glucosamine N-acyltransferase